MAVTPAAERQRRSRAHRRGDHSLCDPARCDGTLAAGVTAPAVAAVTPPLAASEPPAGEPPPEPGPIETMAEAYVDALPYPDGDPRRMLGQLAVTLARRVDLDGAVPASVRELRTLLSQLVEVPNQQSGLVDELRLRRAHRRLDAILARADEVLAADRLTRVS